MSKEDERLDFLCAALLEGRPVDWDSAAVALAPDSHARHLLLSLRRLAEVDQANRKVRFEPAEDLPFTRWRHLILLERLDEGSYGELFRAHDESLGRDVALKLYREDAAPDASISLISEARRLARIRHENVILVHGVDVDHGRVGFWMDLVEGRSLDSILVDEGPQTPRRAVEIGVALARGLSAAHAAGVLQGDVKPKNVVCGADGRVVLVDFGAGRSVPRSSPQLQRTGTPLFMAPETLLKGELTEQSDLYGLGALLFHVLTGRYPVEAGTLEELAALHRMRGSTLVGSSETRRQFLDLRRLRPEVPRALEAIVNRCLASDPQHRFKNATDVETALSRVTRGGRQRGVRLAAFVVGLLAFGILGWAWQGWRQGGTAPRDLTQATVTAPNWILVGEFEGVGGRDGLARSARELLVASLEQSDVVTPISRADLKQGLELAMKPDTTRIVGEVARELAARAGARTCVEGKVDQVLNGYSVIVRLVDTESGRTLLSETALVEQQESFLRDVDRLAKRLRMRLGENATVVRSNRFVYPGKTPSLEAFQWWLRAWDDTNRGDLESSIQSARRAVTIDPGFAQAWVALGVAFGNAGVRDSVAYAFEQARRHQDRLLDWQRTGLDFLYTHVIEKDPQGALKYGDLLIRLRPHDSGIHNNYGNLLNDLGRYDEAIEAYSKACSVAVFGDPIALDNLRRTIVLADGDLDRAAKLVDGLTGVRGLMGRVEIALLKGQWAVADSLLDEFRGAPTLGRMLIKQALRCVRGEVILASRGLEKVVATSSTDEQAYTALCRRLLSFCDVLAPTDSLPRSIFQRNAEALAMVAVLSAMYGEETNLRNSLAGLDSLSDKKPRIDLDIRLAQAWDAVHDRRWQDVVGLLEGALDSPLNPWAGALPLRWPLALAHEQLGDLDSAVRTYELVLRPGRLDPSDAWIRPLLFSFAHQKLVVLYSRRGDLENARKHWEILEATVTAPDPQMTGLLDEARQAMAAASVP